jgi:hypothetical protein
MRWAHSGGEPLQTPWLQVWPEEHLKPHPPQFSSSLARSEHQTWAPTVVPRQHIPTAPSCAAQYGKLEHEESTQEPRTQTAHGPQVSWQSSSGADGRQAIEPLRAQIPEGQASPQTPQLFGSWVRSTQVSEQQALEPRIQSLGQTPSAA